MKTQTQIQVRVDTAGALRNQRYAFSDRYTLITELLQNARRAGATRIDVHYDAKTGHLRIADNGGGIGDFQKLLAFNESGWDDATRQHEHPFGIGFSKCLYSASRCIVRSGDRFVDFLCTHALDQQMIDVHLDPGGHVAGTQIELYDTEMADLSERMGKLCAGFPTEVVYNGNAVPRPYAQGRLELTGSAIGEVHLAGAVSGDHTPDTLVFLQGFLVHSPSHYQSARVNVVHLDPERFMARLPDRDKLIDEPEQLKVIDSEVRRQWRAILEAAMRQLPQRQFVDRYFGAMRTFDHLDLLNGLDELPQGICSAICGYPIMGTDAPEDFLDHRQAPPDRHSIESGRSVMVDLDAVHADNVAYWMFAREKKLLLEYSYMLDDQHWLHDKIRRLSEEALEIEPMGTLMHARFNGLWVGADLVLCDAVQLRVGRDAVEISEDAVYHDGVIFVPAGETTGAAVRQISAYEDTYDSFREYECDTDMDDLADLIRRLRSVDPHETLVSLLQPLRLEKYPVLHGKTFRVHVGQQAAAHSIELIE